MINLLFLFSTLQSYRLHSQHQYTDTRMQKSEQFPTHHHLVYELFAYFLFLVNHETANYKKRLRSLINRRFGGISAVKPLGFRLTERQLAVRRSGPRFSNNYCVSDCCVAIFLCFVGLFHQVFAGCSPH